MLCVVQRSGLVLAGVVLVAGCDSAHAEKLPPAASAAAQLPLPAKPAKPAKPAPAVSAVAAPDQQKKTANLVDGCPPEMARVGRACVDRWEARLLTSDGTPHDFASRPEQGVRYRAESRAGVYPQAYISKPEASAACAAAGKRLCRLTEWYRACKDRQGHVYPYGASFEKARCNSGKAHLLSRLFGRDPRRWKFAEHFNAPELDRTPGFLAKTGEYSGCASDNGTFDMVGNLHEWVSDFVNHDLEKKIPMRDDIRGKIDINRGHSIFMGGFFSTTDQHGRGCQFLTPGHGAKYHDYSTGFRCCKDAAASPASDATAR